MSMVYDSYDSSSDEDFVIEVLQVLPRPRYFRDRENPFTEYEDTDFKQRFRYVKNIFCLTSLFSIYFDI